MGTDSNVVLIWLADSCCWATQALLLLQRMTDALKAEAVAENAANNGQPVPGASPSPSPHTCTNPRSPALSQPRQ